MSHALFKIKFSMPFKNFIIIFILISHSSPSIKRSFNIVLKEEEMNHSRTASQLSISRTTLWRMLKNLDAKHKTNE